MENFLMLISSITTVLMGLVFSKHINISKTAFLIILAIQFLSIIFHTLLGEGGKIYKVIICTVLILGLLTLLYFNKYIIV